MSVIIVFQVFHFCLLVSMGRRETRGEATPSLQIALLPGDGEQPPIMTQAPDVAYAPRVLTRWFPLF